MVRHTVVPGERLRRPSPTWPSMSTRADVALSYMEDLVTLDVRDDSVTATARLRERGVPARVLVLTTYDTDSDVLPAIEAGATGYLLKDAPARNCSGRYGQPPAARRSSPKRLSRHTCCTSTRNLA
jgi:DNA-binding NarL/FixJ family response regulator